MQGGMCDQMPCRCDERDEEEDYTEDYERPWEGHL